MPLTGKTPAALREQFAKGLAEHKQGRIANAELFYKNILQKQPEHFDALHMLGVAALQTNRNALAIQLLQKAISINPNVPGAYGNLGYAQYLGGHYAEALVSYDKAIALQPRLAYLHSNRGNILKE